MSKNLRLYFVLTFALACVVIAWKSLSVSLFGSGVNFVAMLILLAVMLMLICTDKEVKTRTRDLFVVSAVFTFLELILFLVVEIFNTELSTGTIKGFNVYQSVLSFLGLIYFVYIVFRFICEVKGKKIGFVEVLLGNVKREKKVKKAKELTNGSLMEKPNKHKELEETSNFTSIQQTEKTVEPTSESQQVQTNSYIYKNDEHSEN